MRCHRCGEMMIYQKFYGDCEHHFGWKCISCGEIVDRLILENSRPSATAGPRAQERDPAKERMVIIL